MVRPSLSTAPRKLVIAEPDVFVDLVVVFGVNVDIEGDGNLYMDGKR